MIFEKNITVGIIALAGNCEKESVYSAENFLKNRGYNVVLSSNIFDDKNYLAGNDDEKIRELYSFFENPKIDIILNARGGYGSLRLLNQIDYSVIKNNPKPFAGFSDITALLLMIYKNTGMETYHSPMACSDFGNSDIDDLCKDGNLEDFLAALSGEAFILNASKIYKKGCGKGILWGGNLSTVVSLCGIDFIPDKDFIFFAEDLNEPVYKIDRMFQQLLNIDKFINHCKGIVLGDFLNIDNEEWLNEYFQELADKLNIPITGGFEITHQARKITLPIGREAILSDNTLSINKLVQKA